MAPVNLTKGNVSRLFIPLCKPQVARDVVRLEFNCLRQFLLRGFVVADVVQGFSKIGPDERIKRIDLQDLPIDIDDLQMCFQVLVGVAGQTLDERLFEISPGLGAFGSAAMARE